MNRKTTYLLAILTILGLIWVVQSPYKWNDKTGKREIWQTVEIDAPAGKVYAYLGNSGNAVDWSSFVDHITPINETVAKDGCVGSIRRCFRDAAEKAEQWDETTLVADSATLRRLNIFNLKNFPLTSTHLLTEQRYENLGDNKCKLTFTLFLDENSTWLDALKMYVAGNKIAGIFKANVLNIKQLNERKS